MRHVFRTGRQHARAATSLAIAGLFSGGCGGAPPTPSIEFVAIPTSNQTADDQGPCRLALMSGRLVSHEVAGLAIQGLPDSPPEVVVWPKGFAAADIDGVRLLLDETGLRIARVGTGCRQAAAWEPETASTSAAR